MRLLLGFVRIIDTFNTWIARVVSAMLPAMVCVLVLEIIARGVFSKSVLWTYDVSIFLFGYSGLLAGAYVQKLNAHINVDILYSRLSPRGKALVDVITYFLIIYFLVLIITNTWKPAIYSLKIHETSPTPWAPPIGHYKLIIPVASFLLLSQTLANWIRNLYFLIKNKELGDEF